MSDLPHWSLFLARLRRVQFRFHALFLAVAVFAFYLSTSQRNEEAPGYGLLAVGVLLGSVLLHELGHLLAAVRVGGGSDQIVVGPLGGLSHPEIPKEPQAELLVALAGPAVSLGLLLATLPALLATNIDVARLLIPWQPSGLLAGAWWVVTLKLTFWINWVLFLVNLLPAYPLDGGRILRALLTPGLEYRAAGLVAVRASKLCAIGILILAWALWGEQSAAVLPTWVPLSLLALFLFSSASAEAARMEETEWEEELFNYDFSQGYTSLERTMDPPRRQRTSMRQWIENRREMRRRKRRWQEQEEERQVDGILLRLHEVGLDGLSAKERALLNRVSARYRNRQGS
jgi:Zn-dependent protease